MTPETEKPTDVEIAASVETQKIPPLVLINGASKILAKFNDGHTEEVVVNLIPISKVIDYLNIIAEPEKFVEFVTGKSPGWADTLTDDSIWEIDELARAMNDPRIDRYARRQKVTVERLKPIMSLVQG
jgi:hypothetical protein